MPADVRPVSAITRSEPGSWLPALIITLTVFARGLGNGFVFDDVPIVVDNASLSLDGWREWLRGFWPGHEMYFRPLTLASLSIDRAVGGGGPFVFHLTSLVWHAVGACMIASIARRLGATTAGAAIAGVAFGIHPLVTEPACWISARGDVLAAGLTLIAVRVHLAAGAHRWLAAALVLGALLAKESAIVAPAFVILADRALGRPLRPMRYAPMLAALATYVALRTAGLGSILPAAAEPSPLHNPLVGADLVTRLAWPFAALAHTARLVVWPHPLTSDYTYAAILPPSSFAAPIVWVGLALAAGLAAVTVRSFRGSGLIGAALLAAFAAWIPASNALFLHGAIFGERFLYLSLAPLALLVGGLVSRWNVRWMWVPLVACVVAAAIASFTRTADWATNETLFTSAVRARPESAQAHYNLGVLRLDAAGAFERTDPRRARELSDARAAFVAARERYPRYADAHLNEGAALFESGRFDEAVAPLTRAAELDPDDPRAPFSLGRVAEARGDVDGARTYYETSRRLAGGGPAEAALRRLDRIR